MKFTSIASMVVVRKVMPYLIALTMVMSVTLWVGCDTAQSIRANIYRQPKGQVLVAHLDKTGLSELNPVTGVTIVIRVMHEEMDECPGINTFKRDSVELKQAIAGCLSRYPPIPSTFLKERVRKFVDHNNDGLIHLPVAIPELWPNLSLLQITTPDGANYYAYAYTYTSAKLAIIIPPADQIKHATGWGTAISDWE